MNRPGDRWPKRCLKARWMPELAGFIEQLTQRPPVDDLSEADIAAEVQVQRTI